MGNFEFIEHTAGKGFRVEANNLKDLFETSVLGLAKLLREDISPNTDDLSVSEKIEVQAQDETALLVDFLSEILTLSHIQKTVFTGIDIKKIDSSMVRAAIFGNPVDYFDEVIKAVTYHQVDVRESDNGRFTTNIIFDI